MGIDSDSEQNMLVWQLSLAQLLPQIQNQKQAKCLDGYSVRLFGFKALTVHQLLCDPF